MRSALGSIVLLLTCVMSLVDVAGAATKPVTVQQVNDKVQLILTDQQNAVRSNSMFEMAQTLATCQQQAEHVATLKAMARPTRYPKATWKVLMRGADLYAKAASECVTVAQALVANPRGDTSGMRQVNSDWTAGTAQFSKAAAALAKAKIH